MNVRKVISLCCFCLYIVAVGIICFAKPVDIPHLPNILWGIPVDKIIHMLMFTPFPILAYLVLEPARRQWWKSILILTIIFATGVFLAYSTEEIQGWLGYRQYDIKDFYSDIYGLTAGAGITLLYLIFRR